MIIDETSKLLKKLKEIDLKKKAKKIVYSYLEVCAQFKYENKEKALKVGINK